MPQIKKLNTTSKKDSTTRTTWYGRCFCFFPTFASSKKQESSNFKRVLETPSYII